MAIHEVKRKTDGITVYMIDFRDQDGRRVRELAGTTRKQARKLLETRIGEVRAGTYLNHREATRRQQEDQKRRTEERGPTFNAFADDFVKKHAGKARSDHYPDRLKKLRPVFGERYLREITRQEIDAFTAKRLQEVGPATVRRDLAALVTIFNVALTWGVIGASPAAKLRKPQEPKHRTRYLTREEWVAVQTTTPEWLRPMLRIAISTGMRLKEVVGLRWEEVDLSGGVLHVAEDTKTGMRPIPLTQEARAVLNDLGARFRAGKTGSATPFVFVQGDAGDYTSDFWRNRISKAAAASMKAAGAIGATFHTLRHTAAAWMVQRGVPLYEVQKILGHSTPLMTQRYAHLAPEHLRHAADALDAAIRGVDTPVDTRGVAAQASSSPQSLTTH
jgi:integrase